MSLYSDIFLLCFFNLYVPICRISRGTHRTTLLRTRNCRRPRGNLGHPPSTWPWVICSTSGLVTLIVDIFYVLDSFCVSDLFYVSDSFYVMDLCYVSDLWYMWWTILCIGVYSVYRTYYMYRTRVMYWTCDICDGLVLFVSMSFS